MSDMNHDTQPLTECESCRHWTPDECDRDIVWWPDQGDRCSDWEREPGVDQ